METVKAEEITFRINIENKEEIEDVKKNLEAIANLLDYITKLKEVIGLDRCPLCGTKMESEGTDNE